MQRWFGIFVTSIGVSLIVVSICFFITLPLNSSGREQTTVYLIFGIGLIILGFLAYNYALHKENKEKNEEKYQDIEVEEL